MSRRDRIWQLHRQHPTWGLTELAEHLGCSKSNVCYYARREGIVLPKRPPSIEAIPGRQAQILALYDAGRTVKDIAATCGVSLAYVCQLASRNGRGRNRPRLIPNAQVPHWVPWKLREVYKAITRYADEETAAYHVRLLKSQKSEAA